jgi:hypothetical protein
MFKSDDADFEGYKKRYESKLPALAVYATKTGTIILDKPVQSIDTIISDFHAHEDQVNSYFHQLTEMI